jgi:asparagine synthase (glutamine-hydrolysing)
VSFPESDSYDEHVLANALAERLHTTHTTISMLGSSVLAGTEAFLAQLDEPLADPAMLPTFLMAREAAHHVKVILSGEGADEVFNGYRYYKQAGVDDARLQEVSSAQPQSGGDRYATSGFPFVATPLDLWGLLGRDRPEFHHFLSLLRQAEEDHLIRLSRESALQRASYLDLKLWLADNLLAKLDRSTMAFGLEARVPFLDHRLVELAYGLPAQYKLDHRYGKRALRDALKGIVPDELLSQRKHGFSVPIGPWMRGVLRQYVRDVLGSSLLIRDGFLARSAVEQVIAAHEAGQDRGRILWVLVVLEQWWNTLIRGPHRTEAG